MPPHNLATDTWLLDVRGLGCGYGDGNVVADVSFALGHGDIGCLLGPSGCGKSTLLSLITGIRATQRGSIRVAGQAFSALPQRRRDAFRADHIGVIFQAFNLLPYLSAVDNVRLSAGFSRCRRQREGVQGRRQSARAAAALLERLGLERRSRRCPPGSCRLVSSSGWRRPVPCSASRN